MKNLAIIYLALTFFSYQKEITVNVNPLNDHVLSISSQDTLIRYFNETALDLENEITGISKTQMHFKPTGDGWSVSQILEHIVATEQMLLDNFIELTSKPENVGRRPEIMVTDDQLITGMVDRSTKYKTSKELEPKGIYNSPQDALKEFQEVRGKILTNIENYKGNLRNHITDSPAGPVDAHQSLLFIAGHTARHTAQIREVKLLFN